MDGLNPIGGIMWTSIEIMHKGNIIFGYYNSMNGLD
jgi:hypothetical protein